MRIVSLLPSATEICFSLGLGEQVVGVTHECDYPPEALAKPKLTRSMLPESLQTQAGSSAAIDRHVRANVHQGSSLYALDSDLLEALAPDLIITQELCAVCAVSYDIVAGAAKRLRGDPRVISLEPTSLEDVFGTIDTVAQICGVPERATSVLAHLRSRVAALRATTSTLPRPRTLLLEWPDPPMNAGHWIPDIIELAAGEPVLANAGGNSQKLEWKAITQADPDVVVVAPCGYDLREGERCGPRARCVSGVAHAARRSRRARLRYRRQRVRKPSRATTHRKCGNISARLARRRARTRLAGASQGGVPPCFQLFEINGVDAEPVIQEFGIVLHERDSRLLRCCMQQLQDPAIREASELIQSGAKGTLERVFVNDALYFATVDAL